MKFKLSNIWIVLVGVVCMSLSSSVSLEIPQSPVPITLQSLIILSFCLVVRPPLGIISVSLYLLLGIVGLPIFAQGSSGMEVITGKTGGYLIGFLIASLFMGEFNHRQWPLKIGTSLMAMCIGTAIILLSGFTKLGLDIGWVSAFEHGIKPFLGGAFLKIIIGAYLSMVSYRFIIGRAPTT